MIQKPKHIRLKESLHPKIKQFKPGRSRADNQILHFQIHLSHVDIHDTSLKSTNKKFTAPSDYSKKFGDPENLIAKIKDWYTINCDLSYVDHSVGGRFIHFKGTAESINQAFKINLQEFDHEGKTIFGHQEEISIPEVFKNDIVHVGGLNQISAAKKPLKTYRTLTDKNEIAQESETNEGEGSIMTSLDYANLYNYPKTYNDLTLLGAGQRYAIIALGSSWENAESFVKKYCEKFGIPTPQPIIYTQEGYTPGSDAMDTAELCMDLEIPLLIIPEATFEIYFCQNSLDGILWGIQTAIHGTEKKPKTDSEVPTLITTSYAFSDSTSYNPHLDQAIARLTNLFGVPFLSSSGDGGSSFADFPHTAQTSSPFSLNVSYPASNPDVVAVGGTNLNILNNRIADETVWNEISKFGNEEFYLASTGGFSMFQKSHLYQQKFYKDYLDINFPNDTSQVNKRGVPDVAIMADSNFKGCYLITPLVTGQMPIATSGANPLFCSLLVRIAQAFDAKLGNINKLLYTHPDTAAVFMRISDGDNCLKLPEVKKELGNKWHAVNAWNPCTGFGSPIGSKMLDYFKAIIEE